MMWSGAAESFHNAGVICAGGSQKQVAHNNSYQEALTGIRSKRGRDEEGFDADDTAESPSKSSCLDALPSILDPDIQAQAAEKLAQIMRDCGSTEAATIV